MADSLQETLEKIRRRDETAIAELVAAHHRGLRGYVAALSASVDAIDDLSQEVFLRALQRLDRIQDLEDFPRFLRGIARNVIREQARKYIRNSERYVEFVDEAFAAEDKTRKESPFQDASLAGALQDCVGKLTPKARQMLNLRYKEELHADEIGRELGMHGGAVRTSLLRVREALLKCLRASAGHQLKEAGL
jgi:RNA polymerase sigma-70 factor (ECF subfamily)